MLSFTITPQPTSSSALLPSPSPCLSQATERNEPNLVMGIVAVHVTPQFPNSPMTILDNVDTFVGIIQKITTSLSQMPVKKDTKKLRHHIDIDTFQLACLPFGENCSLGCLILSSCFFSVGSFVAPGIEIVRYCPRRGSPVA